MIFPKEEAKTELWERSRPELKTYLVDISEYDNVFVCGPCWWGTFPMAVFSQLERVDFSGKKVIPLMTHEGSGLGSCERDLKKICTGAKFGKGLAIQGRRCLGLRTLSPAGRKHQSDSTAFYSNKHKRGPGR